MIFTLFGLLITSVGTTTAFGQNESIILNIDKTSYFAGETISISGEIKNMIPSNEISLIIQSPNGNLVALDQMTVGSDKQFSTEIKLGGKLMKQEGTYTIKVQYGEQSITTSFEFGGVTDFPENALEEAIVEDTVEDTVEDIDDRGSSYCGFNRYCNHSHNSRFYRFNII